MTGNEVPEPLDETSAPSHPLDEVARPMHRGQLWKLVSPGCERFVRGFRSTAELVITCTMILAVAVIGVYLVRFEAWSGLSAGLLATIALCVRRPATGGYVGIAFAGVVAAASVGLAIGDSLDPTRLPMDDLPLLMLSVILCAVAPGALASIRQAKNEPTGIPIIVFRYATFEGTLGLVVGLLISSCPLLIAPPYGVQLGLALVTSAAILLAVSTIMFDVFARTRIVGISAVLVHLASHGVTATPNRWGYTFTIGDVTVRRIWFAGDSVGYEPVQILTRKLGVPTPSQPAMRQLAGDLAI